MSPASPEELERECREALASAREQASHNLAVAGGDARLGEPSARFLADFERIEALSGKEFCEEVRAAIDRLNNETQAAHGAAVRWLFEEVCVSCPQLIEAQDGWYSKISTRGQPREPSPTGKRFREQTAVFLADADRIRALTGQDFIREAQAALDAFTTLDDMAIVKSEIYTEWAETPFLRRWRMKIRGRFMP